MKKFKFCGQKTVLYLLLIVSASFIAFSNSFNASFQFDDVHHIHQSRHIKDFESFKSFDFWFDFYNRSPAIFTLAINYRIGEYSVKGYHVFNFLIHISASILIFFLTGKILRSDAIKQDYIVNNRRYIQLFASLIFAVHPIQTESVTHIVQRMESMSAAFLFAALICYLKLRNSREIKRIIVFSSCFVVFSVISILTKQAGYSVPLAVLVLELCFVRNEKGEMNKTLVSVIFFGLLFAGLAGIAGDLLPREHWGKAIARSEYLFTQATVIPRYVMLLIIPSFQNIDHDILLRNSFFDPAVIGGSAFVVSLLFFGLYLFRKGHIIFSFAIFWFFAMIFLRSSILPIGDFMAERRLYAATLSVGLAMPAFLFWAGSKVIYLSKRRLVIPVTLIFITAIYSISCINRNKVWKNELTLWTDSVSKSPGKFRPNYNAGEAYMKHGFPEKALHYYYRAYSINPLSFGVTNNIGSVYARLKNDIKAEEFFKKAIETNPQYANAMNNLANLYLRNGRTVEAEELYLKVIEIDKDFVAAYQNLGTLYLIEGSYEKAGMCYSRVLELDPENHRAAERLRMIESMEKDNAR